MPKEHLDSWETDVDTYQGLRLHFDFLLAFYERLKEVYRLVSKAGLHARCCLQTLAFVTRYQEETSLDLSTTRPPARTH